MVKGKEKNLMKRILFVLLCVMFLLTVSAAVADTTEDSGRLDAIMKEANTGRYDELWSLDENRIPRYSPDYWNFKSGLVLALYNIFGDQTENSLSAAQNGYDFYGIPNEWLAPSLAEADTVLLLQQVSVTSSSKSGQSYYIYARLIQADPETDEIIGGAATIPVTLTPAEKEAFNLFSVRSCTEFLADYAEKKAHPDGYQDRYDQAMALYNDEQFYSARQAFLESKYGDWESMAEKCIRTRPSSGELWHDPAIWLRDMSVTFQIDQPEDTSIFIRLYKDGKPVSYLFVAGPGKVSTELPGNGYYTIKDGVGVTWYGEKEAFGPDGSYETMTFDNAGTEKIYLQSNYEYTISINIDAGGEGIGSRDEDWDSFAEN